MADSKIDSVPVFAPIPAGNRIQDFRDQEIDVAMDLYPGRTREEAVTLFRQEIAERTQRTEQRESDAAEQARTKAEEIKRERWAAFNPDFETLCRSYLTLLTDIEPPSGPINSHQRDLIRWIGMILREHRKLVMRVEALEEAAR